MYFKFGAFDIYSHVYIRDTTARPVPKPFRRERSTADVFEDHTARRKLRSLSRIQIFDSYAEALQINSREVRTY